MKKSFRPETDPVLFFSSTAANQHKNTGLFPFFFVFVFLSKQMVLKRAEVFHSLPEDAQEAVRNRDAKGAPKKGFFDKFFKSK